MFAGCVTTVVFRTDSVRGTQFAALLFTLQHVYEMSLVLSQKEHQCNECMCRTYIADDTRNGGRIENPRQEQISNKGMVELVTSKP